MIFTITTYLIWEPPHGRRSPQPASTPSQVLARRTDMHALDTLQLLQINFWTLAMVILFGCLTHRDQWAARSAFGAMTALLLINYAVWRIRDTLPDSHAGVATVWSYSFLFFELLAIVYTLFSIIVMLCRS